MPRYNSWGITTLSAPGLLLLALGLLLNGCSNEQTGSTFGPTLTKQQALTQMSVPVDTFLPLATPPGSTSVAMAIGIKEWQTNINGTPVTITRYTDLNRPEEITPLSERQGMLVPQIVADVGDRVSVYFENQLPEDCGRMTCNSSIHSHGIELDNDSDGTGVTQNSVKPGESYIYRFFPPRPGVFWFHPHMKPAEQVFAGAYGALIIRDPREQELIDAGVLPPEDNTHTIVLADTDFSPEGVIAQRYDVNPEPDEEELEFRTWSEIIEDCLKLRDPEVESEGLCDDNADGHVVMVNGQSTADVIPEIRAAAGTGIRLRLINTATHRYFRLAVQGNGADNNLYRIGGEGGLLERVRLEGGEIGTFDTKYERGEILLPASARSDVIIVPQGSDGDVITIAGLPPDRGGRAHLNAAGDLLHIVIDNSLPGTPMTINEGDPILGDGAIEDLSTLSPIDSYIAPVPELGGPGSGNGLSGSDITLEGLGPGMPGIDGYLGHLETSGDDYSMVPFADAARYARVGDVLELTIRNLTRQHHPFHHHGFSFQPLRIVDAEDPSTVLYEYDYREFQDVIDVPPGIPPGKPHGRAVVVRMRLDDRPRLTDTRQEASAPEPNQFFASGGAAGRWVFHCHIFSHAALGMISELVVLDADRDGDGLDTSADCDDENPDIPIAVELCDDELDNNCDGVVDEPACNHAPEVDAGMDVSVECAQPGGAVVNLSANASDPETDALSFQWEAEGIAFDDSNVATTSAMFPLGTTTVSVSVSDGWQTTTDQVAVTVVDSTPPLLSVVVTPDVLTPPNGSLVDIQAVLEMYDACDPAAPRILESIVNDQFTSTGADPDIAGAELGTDDREFQLRASRDPSDADGRTYTVTYSVTDASGNPTTAAAQVLVPRGAGGGGTAGSEPPAADPPPGIDPPPSPPPGSDPPGSDPPGADPPSGSPPGTDPPGRGSGRPPPDSE